ncbi:MFS general substrate transporter [Glonium stellatum]|uniref:MFS general substrate transporter n=1 Tax=Glonium stellatum TaxID=574774 RepID=A0A8E2F4R7_9PEZI|nr:MFS general substrate transporter [Glonium stellatum]
MIENKGLSSNSEEIPSANSSEDAEGSNEFQVQERSMKIRLLPHPTDDPRDPLNWTTRKKVRVLAVICFAVFSGIAAPLTGQLNLMQQAKLYHKTVFQMAYSSAAGTAGLASGGFFLAPLAHKFGKSSIIFWSLVGCFAAQIWAPCMTGRENYNAYVVSRFVSGFFGGLIPVLGPRILVDIFFLHQRGRAFTAFHMSLDFGTLVGPTFSAFISAKTNWPAEYWWSVALIAVSAICVFLFIEDTSYDRTPGAVNAKPAKTFLQNRLATFFFGTKVVRQKPWSSIIRMAAIPFRIAVTPVAVTMGGFALVSFGFYIAFNSLTPIWLQKPKRLGGYGFTVEDNAYFNMVHWIGLAFAITYSYSISDCLPLYLTARYGGTWKPEYRLHALWLPSFILSPLGLALTAIGLHYRLHWIILAFGSLFLTIGALTLLPVIVNYACESFIYHSAEASQVISLYRLAFGLSIPFFISGWVDTVGLGWVYGMMALFALFCFGFVILLIWKGHEIRSLSAKSLNMSEDGEKIVQTVGPRNTLHA